MNGFLAIEFIRPNYDEGTPAKSAVVKTKEGAVGEAEAGVELEVLTPAVAAEPAKVVSHTVLGGGWQKIVDGECVALYDVDGKEIPLSTVHEYRLTDGMNFKTPPFVQE